MKINLDDSTVIQLTKLAQQHDLSLDDMMQQLILSYEQRQADKDDIPPSQQALRYYGLFEQSNDAVFLLSLDGQHLDFNQRAAELLGYTLAELEVLSFSEIVKQSEHQASANLLERLIAGDKLPPYQRTYIHKDGSEIPVEVNVECIFDNLGNPLYIQSIARDIRERLILINSLQESERRFRAIFNSTYTFIGLMHPDGTMIETNQIALDFAGISLGNTLGKPLWEIGWFIGSEAVQAQVKQAIRRSAQGEFVRYETQLDNQNGVSITVDFSITPVEDEEGQVVLLVPEARDISERKVMEKRLQESEHRYRTILSAMAEGVVIHDETGAITLVNPAAEEMLGLTFNQMRGLTPIDPRWHTIRDNGDLFPGETHPASISLSQGIPQNNIVMGVYKPDNSLTWLSINSIPLSDDYENVSGVIATFSDITDLKQAEEIAVRIAVERERIGIIARFIQAASHEFRTPLSIISTSAYILRRKYGELTPDIAEHAHKIDEQINRINRLLAGLLLMAKVDVIVKPTKTRQIDLGLLISEIVPTISNQMSSKHQNLNLKGMEQRIIISGNKENLVYAIDAVLDNAIRFSTIYSELTLTLKQSNDKALLIIEDQGIGIEPDDLPYIFQRFWRKDLSHNEEGFGLGLSIAQRIVELHQGTITVESTLNKGTKVIMSFPLSVN